MIAVILAAGKGTRLRPMTNSLPKCLLEIGNISILKRMLTSVIALKFDRVIMILGFEKNKIKEEVNKHFPNLKVTYIENPEYDVTNNGYSLCLAKSEIENETFVKFDADVVFDHEILEKLVNCEYESCLCYDSSAHLEHEEVKVLVNEEQELLKANKELDPKSAHGESVGIEKISARHSSNLFVILESMMAQNRNHQHFYEKAYEKGIEKGEIVLNVIDIKENKWIEIDTERDLKYANRLFANS